ncbi:hypothetical protein T07_47 [Trichinella nelsoni]|uniref:Uncharacterized protein n=1 Tax=Trichinella nelsoni TaxID=6336 RepID=A0A0V0RBD2_9BILA|nr:hypothetical protein T07_47 [Trichinella nelsoni]
MQPLQCMLGGRLLHETRSGCVWTMDYGCFIHLCPLLLKNYGSVSHRPSITIGQHQL